MKVLEWQCTSMAVLYISLVTSFLGPCWYRPRGPGCKTGFSLANCFSGGVFAATFFTGLLPQVRDNFEQLFKKKGTSTGFPLSEFLVFVGFFLSFFIEQLTISFREKKNQRTLKGQNFEALCGDDSVENAGIVEERSSNDDAHESHSDIAKMLANERGVKFILLLGSMGTHSLLEGLALGLQTNIIGLWNLFAGVLIHECLVGFGVGACVAKLNMPMRSCVKIALLFSASIPLGQVFGLVFLFEASFRTQLLSAMLQALAAGTFVHVTFFEVIPAEFRSCGHRLTKTFFILVGFATLLICNVGAELLASHPSSDDSKIEETSA